MDELLKRIVVLVSKCEFTPEQKENNIISRLTENPEPIFKSLKDAHPNDFSKSKSNRGQAKPSDGLNKRVGYNKNYNDRGYDNKSRYTNDKPPQSDEWRAEEDEMVQKLKKQSKKFMEEAKTEKQDYQRVRLWLNQISPDNFEKKSGELRELLIGSAKLLSEPGFDKEEA